MDAKAIAFANNDIAYIWWRYPSKIERCLGFSVRRLASKEIHHEVALPALVGFSPPEAGKPHEKRTTDEWPIQSFQWKDVFAEPGSYRYKIVPMLGPDPENLVADEENVLTTDVVHITGDYGNIKAYFNVGLISTQAITTKIKSLVGSRPGYKSSTAVLLGEIAREGSEIRHRLAGDVLKHGVLSQLNRAKEEGGDCHLALYELTDRQLINSIKELSVSDQINLCLSNADSSTSFVGVGGKPQTTKLIDGTNQLAREELRQENVRMFDRFVPSSSIGHNKFVVYSKHEEPNAVTTGSVNWTSTGLCSQTNNAISIESSKLARGFRDYWERLVADAEEERVQGPDLRQWCGSGAIEDNVDGASVRVWFSPNTTRRTKGDDTPPDLLEVFSLIESAKKGVLFLAFNPGTPSCLAKIQEKAVEMREQGMSFYVRGAVTDVTPLGQFATFLTKRDALETPDVLVTGVAGVPDDYAYWEKELFKIGHAVIHDKIIVIDPFSPDCVVVTGSHNLGFKASYQNDENLVIIKGHQRLAQAYAAHVLDVTNHFAWRSKLTASYKSGKMEKAWGDLDETDAWQNKYYRGGDSASRDSFFFLD